MKQTLARCSLIASILFVFLVAACSTRTPTSPTATIQTLAGPTPLVTATPLLPTAIPTVPQSLVFDGKNAYDAYLLGQLQFGARPAGSVALRATGDYIFSELQKSGWQTETQEFTYRDVPIRNIIAKTGQGQGPLIILGAHYDTRPRANMDKQNPNAPVMGANDAASGAAVLLELARTLDRAKLKNEVWLAFLDAEDNGDLTACDLNVAQMQTPTAICDMRKWPWSIGAIHLAENLQTKPAAVIILDMIGDANQNIYYERNSDEKLQQILWGIAEQLGYGQWFIPQVHWSMTDDHTPFLQKGIRAVDMIDFDYPQWHTTQDTAEWVSAASLERVGRVVETWLENGALTE